MIDAELAALPRGRPRHPHRDPRTNELQPNGARVTAVKVDDDGTHLSVYVPQVAAATGAARPRSNGPAAVVLRAVRSTIGRAR